MVEPIASVRAASPLLDKTGLKRISPISSAVIPGLIAFWEPGTMADRSLVPANGALIENQSGWAIDQLGESARYFTFGNSLITGVASRHAVTGAFNVVHGRGVATQGESISLANQRIRDHIDGNRSRRLLQFWGYEVLQAPAVYAPAISQRFSGLVDNTNYKAALALSSDRTQVTGYLTGATRVFNQPGLATGGRSLAITVHDGYTGAASASPTLFLQHNGGESAPGMSARTFMWGMVDMTIPGLTMAKVIALIQARYDQTLAPGGIYAA